MGRVGGWWTSGAPSPDEPVSRTGRVGRRQGGGRPQEAATGFIQGAQWVDGRQELFTGPDGLVGAAKAANSDGSIVVGRVCSPAADQARRSELSKAPGCGRDRTARDACPRHGCVSPPVRRSIVEANATSDDGRVIGGGQGIGGSDDSDAVIWIDRVPFYLKDYLRANGVPDAFETWVNTGSITDISPDGRVLVGKGAAALGFRGYIVILGDKP